MWEAAAVDERVVALAPIVAPVGQLVPQLNRHWQVYNGWSWVLSDYLNVFAHLNTANFAVILEYDGIDTYQPALAHKPKLMTTGLLDEFFIPEAGALTVRILDTAFFCFATHCFGQYSTLEGERLLHSVANGDHPLLGYQVPVLFNVLTFFNSVRLNLTRPSFVWSVDYAASGKSGSITGVASGTLVKSTLWTATSARGRDFRKVCFRSHRFTLLTCAVSLCRHQVAKVSQSRRLVFSL